MFSIARLKIGFSYVNPRLFYEETVFIGYFYVVVLVQDCQDTPGSSGTVDRGGLSSSPGRVFVRPSKGYIYIYINEPLKKSEESGPHPIQGCKNAPSR